MEGGATKICGAPKLHPGPNLKLRAGKDFLLRAPSNVFERLNI